MSSGKTCLQKTPCILILKYLKVAITIIPTDCSENYAVKDQYNSDGVKNLYLPSKLKKKSLFTCFTNSPVLSTKDDQEQKTEEQKKKKNRRRRKIKGGNKEK